jgi:hypothetical protein
MTPYTLDIPATCGERQPPGATAGVERLFEADDCVGTIDSWLDEWQTAVL